jgi:tRNA (guanine-N7-)-methyltransferase
MTAGLSHRRPIDPGHWEYILSELPAPSEDRLDPRTWFDDPALPFEMEIGSGKGTFLVQQAKLQANTNFLGAEWAAAYAHHSADRFRRHGLGNVRMLLGNGVEFVEHWCPDAIAQVIHLYFSDPWPKSRHYKRRVVQDASLVQFHRLLGDGGELRLVTDHDDLWHWYEHHAARNALLFERVEFTSPASAGDTELVGTNFERKFIAEGRQFRSMTLVKKG